MMYIHRRTVTSCVVRPHIPRGHAYITKVTQIWLDKICYPVHTTHMVECFYKQALVLRAIYRLNKTIIHINIIAQNVDIVEAWIRENNIILFWYIIYLIAISYTDEQKRSITVNKN